MIRRTLMSRYAADAMQTAVKQTPTKYRTKRHHFYRQSRSIPECRRLRILLHFGMMLLTGRRI